MMFCEMGSIEKEEIPNLFSQDVVSFCGGDSVDRSIAQMFETAEMVSEEESLAASRSEMKSNFRPEYRAG